MKIAALVLGLVGSLLVMGLGAKWVSDYKENEQAVKESAALLQQMEGLNAGSEGKKLLETLERRVNAGRAMVGLGLLALVASPFVFKLPRLAGGAMALAALVPAALAPPTLLFGFLLLLGALFAFIAKPKLRTA